MVQVEVVEVEEAVAVAEGLVEAVVVAEEEVVVVEEEVEVSVVEEEVVALAVEEAEEVGEVVALVVGEEVEEVEVSVVEDVAPQEVEQEVTLGLISQRLTFFIKAEVVVEVVGAVEEVQEEEPRFSLNLIDMLASLP